MDPTRGPSPPSIALQRVNGPHRTTKPVEMLPSRTRGPMPIPNSRGEPPPPPLPPPTHMEDIAAGSDPGWTWGNRLSRGIGGESRGSIGSEPSLPHAWRNIKQERDEGAERPGYMRRGSSQTTIKPAPELDTKYDFSRHHDEGYYSLSGPSPANYQLHGVKDLERRNLESSSHAYDNKLLSKIGKPKTPPRALTAGLVDASPSANLPFYQSGKHPHPLRSVSVSDGSSNGPSDFLFRKQSFPSRFGGSPHSRPISPGMISSGHSPLQYMDHRSPIQDGSTPSSATESEGHPRRFPPRHGLRHQRSRRSGSGVFGTLDESAEPGGHTQSRPGVNTNNTSSESARWYRRDSSDQPIMFPEPDSANCCDFPMEETVTASALRQLQLEDRSPLSSLDSAPSSYYRSSKSAGLDSRSGMNKRKQPSSPPPEAAHEDKAPSLLVGEGTELYHRHPTSTLHLSANQSPQNRFAPSLGSISSLSSTRLRNGSYASSNGLSVVSSMTSMSSHDRLSPGGISPSSDQQHNGRDSPYVTAMSMNSSPQNPTGRTHPQNMPDASEAATAHKLLGENTVPRRHLNAPNIQAHAHICECCPKKPKKFLTLEELKNHESEKQYQCQFCHNRFKNKNEAERHQNSLHLRRHSWSCATLAGRCDAAFHCQPQIPPSNNPNDPSAPMNFTPPDVCGYCGEEFPNEPLDWEARMTHLTNVHKFGECNQSKKFFRADHFRQHLKHSHAGTSGKWTNMLENACMKDEPPLSGSGPGPEMMQPPGAPVAHMGGMMGMVPVRGMPMNIMGGMRDDRIDEMHEDL